MMKLTIWLWIIVSVCLIISSTPAKAGVPERNVATHKQAKQSTTYSISYASLAVDGVLDPDNPSCTLSTVHSWWAVDLVERFLIQTVIVTTDNNAPAVRRYDGLTVGLDNISPWNSAPVWLEYALCSRYVGPPVTPPVNLTFPCTGVGNANRYRYVVVQSAYAFPAAVCLAEVQVFVNGWRWQGVTGHKLINNKVEDANAVSGVDCINLCVLHDVCDSVNFRSSDSSCELSTHPPTGLSPDDTVVDSRWMHWHITADLIV